MRGDTTSHTGGMFCALVLLAILLAAAIAFGPEAIFKSFTLIKG